MRPLLIALLLAFTAQAAPWDSLSHRSVSRSHQFIVYSDDPNARAAIAMDAEDTKDKLLKLLNANDTWRHPIVIQLTSASAADPDLPPSDVRIVNTDDGFKVELNIVLGTDPAQAHFPQQLVRALLLEYAYRPAHLLPSATYSEPPAWLINGLASLTADPDPAASSSLFRSLIESGKTPTLGDFLSENPATLDTPSLTLFNACSMSLVRLLTGLPGGPALMQGYLRHTPDSGSDPEAELLKAFPPLNSTGGQSLEKWWTLGLASLSAADRYQGLSLQETSDQLDALLTLTVTMDKSGTTKTFTLDQYSSFAKAPGAIPALNNLSIRLLGLQAQATPVMRDTVSAYLDIVTQLTRRRAAHLSTRLAEIAAYRKRLAAHMDQIADYLNWYEATQSTQSSGSFDEYIRTADQIDQETPSATRTDPISKYLDSMEQELSQ